MLTRGYRHQSRINVSSRKSCYCRASGLAMRGRYEGAARWRVYCTLQQLQHMGYGSLYLAQTHKVLRGWCNAAMSAFLWKLRSMHHVGLGGCEYIRSWMDDETEKALNQFGSSPICYAIHPYWAN